MPHTYSHPWRWLFELKHCVTFLHWKFMSFFWQRDWILKDMKSGKVLYDKSRFSWPLICRKTHDEAVTKSESCWFGHLYRWPWNQPNRLWKRRPWKNGLTFDRFVVSWVPTRESYQCPRRWVNPSGKCLLHFGRPCWLYGFATLWERGHSGVEWVMNRRHLRCFSRWFDTKHITPRLRSWSELYDLPATVKPPSADRMISSNVTHFYWGIPITQYR